MYSFFTLLVIWGSFGLLSYIIHVNLKGIDKGLALICLTILFTLLHYSIGKIKSLESKLVSSSA